MSFYYFGKKAKHDTIDCGLSVDLLHRYECKVCPLARQAGLHNKGMQPTGAKSPRIYILNEAPSGSDDRKGKHFTGEEGETLRMRLSDSVLPLIRWNSVVRTRTPQDRAPRQIEIEACRPSIVRDIEASKPEAIFGFGNAPLYFALGQNGIGKWAGKRVPVKIGNHACWYFPMMHPSSVIAMRKYTPNGPREYGCEQEFAFALELRRAVAAVLSGLPQPVVETEADVMQDVHWIDGSNGDADVDRVLRFLALAAKQKFVGLDYECNQLRPYNNDSKLLTIGIALPISTLAFPIDHPGAQWTWKQRNAVVNAYRTFLLEAPVSKVVHQLSFEMEWSAYLFGRKTLYAQPWEDTKTQAWVLDERKGTASLDFLAKEYFGVNLKSIANLDRKNIEGNALYDVLPYNGSDAKYHLKVFFKLRERIKREGLTSVYEHMRRRVPATVLTQIKGAPIDQRAVDYYHEKYNTKLKKITAKIEALSVVQKFKELRGKAFRPSAPQDLTFVLTRMLGIPLDAGVNKKALKEIDHPIASLVLEWRAVAKIISTYIKPAMRGSPQLYPDGCIHPVISTTSTDTSRTSSEEPNSQNYPKRSKAKEIRRTVRPSAERRVVTFDYSGMQARNIAMESRDKALVRAFWSRYDIHKDWRDRLAAIHPPWVKGGAKAFNDKEVAGAYRHRAKNEFVFPSFFGAQPRSMALSLGIPERKVERVHDELFDRFPDIHAWQQRIIRFYKKHGYVTGLSGVRRRAPISPNKLINAPIQADEALLVTEAMERLSKIAVMQDLWAVQPTFEIHDDLTFIWLKHKIDEYSEIVITEMLRTEYHDWINVPLEVEMGVGRDWGTVEETGKYASDTWKKSHDLHRAA